MSPRKFARRQRREVDRQLKRLKIVVIERADLERVELEPIASAALFDMLRMHDSPRVSEDEMRERWVRWAPAIDDAEPLQRLAFSWRLYARSRPLQTGQPADFVEFLDLVNRDVILRALLDAAVSS